MKNVIVVLSMVLLSGCNASSKALVDFAIAASEDRSPKTCSDLSGEKRIECEQRVKSLKDSIEKQSQDHTQNNN